MSAADTFFDTNVLLYLFSGDGSKADRAEILLAAGGVISVQVLNEFASVASRKLAMPMAEIREALAILRAVLKVVPLTEETHDLALSLAERYAYSIYDALILAAALQAGCQTLVTEDMQDGQVIEGQVKIRNPFRES
ncbi:MAG: PIN domain-containing protein [Rhodocyclaceae bacterium]|nr:PIN domain-containing protein [Rhodocyclaceae bacterium]